MAEFLVSATRTTVEQVTYVVPARSPSEAVQKIAHHELDDADEAAASPLTTDIEHPFYAGEA
ncbi:hypothetical protein [Novosphingobium sp. LASN5T]|uniref:hypothetical protein n=1 Tax=Novosphingobium sp. LASN5T TaxID=2491021 RepID=UPI000F5F5F51|nr:hypothetical protein [Novosphingobium sp. LASN5T]RQW44673.1 hypothetical protein EH199_08040 [Novosphingobium sp. LASN5T]